MILILSYILLLAPLDSINKNISDDFTLEKINETENSGFYFATDVSGMFNKTKINFQLSVPCLSTGKIYLTDAYGVVIRNFVKGDLSPGLYKGLIDLIPSGNNIDYNSGLYWVVCELSCNTSNFVIMDFKASCKFLVIK